MKNLVVISETNGTGIWKFRYFSSGNFRMRIWTVNEFSWDVDFPNTEVYRIVTIEAAREDFGVSVGR